MGTIRRWYAYVGLTVGLILVMVGIPDLIRIAIEQLGRGTLDATRVTRDDLSRAIAFSLVGVVVWIGHAWLAGTLVRGDDSSAHAERGSTLRSVTLTTTIVILLSIAGWLGFELVRDLLRPAFGIVDEWGPEEPARRVGLVLTSLALALPYARWRIQDHRRAPDRVAGDLATRVVLYGTLAILASTWLLALRDLTEPLLRSAVGLVPAGATGTRWWAEPVVTALAMLVIAAPAWLALRILADRVAASRTSVGASHRHSRLRAAATHAVTGFAAVITIAAVARSLGAIGEWVGGVAPEPTVGLRLAAVVGPLFVVLPVAAGGFWHAVIARAEWHIIHGAAGAASAIRFSLHTVALAGLAWLAWGVVRLLVLGLEPLPAISGTVLASATAAPVAAAAGVAVAGLLAWAPAWTLLERARAADPVGTAGSLARRASLAAILVASVTAAATSMAWVVYRIIRELLGATPSLGDPATESLAILAVALLVLGYHGAVLWRDVRVTRTSHVHDQPTLGIGEELELSLPADTDLAELNARIRALLPPGSGMRVRHRVHV